MTQNPYQSPAADPLQPLKPTIICPFCGYHECRSPQWTIWGGVIGPKLLHHSVCQRCDRGFNRKTGRSNLAWIIAIQVIGFVLGLVLAAILFVAR